jgi:hypothetical protein
MDRLRIRPLRDITTTPSLFDHETWVECLGCGRVWKATAVPGLIHGYVTSCPTCAPTIWPAD